MKKYTFFWRGPFSNWYPSKFEYKGHEFENSEQAFMWEKADFFGDSEIAKKILITKDPKDCKVLGRQIANYNDEQWKVVRFDFMYKVCLEKFKQNPSFEQKLLENENYVEASPFDRIWGIGMGEGDPGIENPSNWKGENLLGQVLDKVKLTLINEKQL